MQKELERHGNCPSVELPVGELEYFPGNILAPTIYQWRRESVNNSPIIVSSFDKIAITSKLINHREPWSSISKNGDIVIVGVAFGLPA